MAGFPLRAHWHLHVTGRPVWGSQFNKIRRHCRASSNPVGFPQWGPVARPPGQSLPPALPDLAPVTHTHTRTVRICSAAG